MKKIKAILSKLLNANFLVRAVLVPIILLTLYCGSFATLHSFVFDDGVNYYFTLRMAKYLSIFAGGIIALTLIALFFFRYSKTNPVKPSGTISASYLILLFLPLTSIVQYLFCNRDFLSIKAALVVIGFFIIFGVIYLIGIPALMQCISPIRILVSLGTAFTFTIYNMALLTGQLSWFKYGSMKIQLPLFVVVFLIAWLLLGLKRKRDLIIIVALFFIGNSLFSILSTVHQEEFPHKLEQESRLQAHAIAGEPAKTSNIYLLVYDAYVTNETMQSYGIDNHEQEAYLEALGFVHYPKTYSLGAYTVTSMSRVLNASEAYYGDKIKGVSGDGIIQNTLISLGYETYGLFPADYMFRNTTSYYNFSCPEESRHMSSYLISAILMGEFRFDLLTIGFDTMTHAEYVQIKQDIFRSISDDPVFIYAHTNLPNHSQNSGQCLSNETQLYEERLREANLEMGQDITIILENDPKALIIIAGDHGPYLTKNCMNTIHIYDSSEINRQDLQDRLGCFLAVKWPSGNYAAYDDITILQDLFPAVFAYLYEDDEFLDDTLHSEMTDPVSGVTVVDGIIQGGMDDGEPLFLADE